MDLDIQFKELQNMQLQLSECLADLERRSELGTVKLDLEKQAELSTSISNYTRNVGNFAVQVRDLPEMNRKKGLWEIRAQQLTNECERLRISFSKFLARLDEIEKEQRKQLLDSNHSKDYATRMQLLNAESVSINNSQQMADEMLSTGLEIVTSIENQEEKLHNSRMRIRNMGDVLGTTKKVMNSFIKRASGDSKIVYGGIAVIVATVLLLVIWKKFL